MTPVFVITVGDIITFAIVGLCLVVFGAILIIDALEKRKAKKDQRT